MEISTEKNIYHIVKHEHVPTIINSQEQLPDWSFDTNPTVKQCMDYEVQRHLAINNKEKFERVCDLLSQASSSDNKTILNSETRHDLNILVGGYQTPTQCLANKIDRTKTAVGKATLCGKLINPVTSFEELMVQQNMVRTLQRYSENFDEIFDKAAKCESNLLSFWEKYDGFLRDLSDDRLKIPLSKKIEYLKKLEEWFNESELGLEFQEIKAIGEPYVYMSLPITSAIVALRKRNLTAFFSSIGLLLVPSSTSISGKIHATAKLYSAEKLANFVGYVAGAWEQKSSAASHFEQINNRLYKYQCMQRKLIGLNTFLKTLEEAKNNTDCLAYLEDLPSLKVDCTENTKNLKNLLDSNTFTQEGLLSNWGRIKLVYKLVHRCKEELLPSYKAFGMLEFLFNSAKLLKENPEKFCYPKYMSDISPKILANSYWNPFLNVGTALENDLSLGGSTEYKGESYRAIIVTGKNGKGKTTNTTLAIPLAVLLSQTMFIVPAREFQFTPVSKFLTVIKNETDIGQGRSLFQSIANRVGKIRKAIKEGSGFAIVALDEPFGGGTSGELANSSAYVISKEMGMDPNAICIVTTHFSEPLRLEEEYPDNFANFRVTEDFRLEKGVGQPDEKRALQILEEESGADFAEQVQHKLKSKKEQQ